ncbi:nuclear pore complex protein NUP1 isoform X1 [Diospyros lotus]|uniref:nuclear pore complex protein NUP1 isoform X1 n=1 Tax=Diospyros lotus TaxID=55363 RepID=UPI002255FF69|nr:nuclear pore complex protein NUP1 isoform X1 [Diospyros lotus]
MAARLPMPSSSGLYGGAGGAGGKFKKPPARRQPTTPYERPPANQRQPAAHPPDSGWLSKLVDPARRLIAGGAIRIFPSFFSKSPLAPAAAAAADELITEDHGDKGGSEEKENAYSDNEGCTLNLGSGSTGGTNPSIGADTFNTNSDFGQVWQDKESSLGDGTELLKIEQLVKGRRFSRDEINHLLEILNSRGADVSNNEPDEKKQKMGTIREGKGPMLILENPHRITTEEKQEGLSVGTSLPLLQSAVIDEVGASPVDVARAYMGSRLSEIGTDSKWSMSKDERLLVQNDGFAKVPLISSPSPKSSVCWPGTMLEDRQGYSTPQNVSRRFRHNHFQGTPYSRPIHSRIAYSKSNSMLTHLEADKNKSLDIFSTPRQRCQTPLYSQAHIKSKGDGILDDIRSVGPIRRMRHKFLPQAPARGSVSLYFPQRGTSSAANSEGYMPAIKKNLEAGETSTASEFKTVDNAKNSSEVGIATLQTSNPAARAILEHLDRNKPTAKEKSAELQLVTAWKKSSSARVTDAILKERIGLTHLEGSDSHKNTEVEKEPYALGTGGKIFEVKPQQRFKRETTDVNKDAGASTVNGVHSSQIKCTTETASLGFTGSRHKGTNDLWPFQSQIRSQGIANTVSNSAGSEMLSKPSFHTSGAKPVLPSISVGKPDMTQVAFSVNNSAFTFPVSTSSGILSEPPTPSILPSTSASSLPQQNVDPAVPSYSFGDKRSSPALIFSFTSTSSIQDGTSNLNFSFGSDKNGLSFGSFGKDAICY